jgi:hypothetical protein
MTTNGAQALTFDIFRWEGRTVLGGRLSRCTQLIAAPSIDTVAGDGSFPHVNSGGALRLETTAVVTFEPTVRAACYNRRNFSAMSAAHAGRIPGASSPRAPGRPAAGCRRRRRTA